ncbi:transferrin receptor protein 1 [Rhinophrynus dorsalis]
MERAQSAVTNFFGRVPLSSYTRFSLTQQTDGDASQVEMKLSDEEECGDHTVEDHVVKHRDGNGNCKSLCLKILAAAFLFLLGFLIGYLSYRGRCLPVTSTEQSVPEESETDIEPELSTVLSWSDLHSILTDKTKKIFFDTHIRKLSDIDHEAGSSNVALMMHEEFGKMSLDKVWNDEHYVKLQEKSTPNKVIIFGDDDQEETLNPKEYVAYSPAMSVTGNLVYCHYGRQEDFKIVQEKNIDLSGNLVLVRSGLISFSEKVRNAQLFKAIGVLIYPDPSDFAFLGKQSGTIESPFGHAHYGTGDPYTPGFPSFNHTQFPPSKSSGLPEIPVQTLSSEDGKKLLEKLTGEKCPQAWGVTCSLGPRLRDIKNIKLEVNNIVVEKKIYNIFGVIRGFEEPDRYVVVGAQRDAKGPGVVKAGVGTSLLLELAHIFSDMVKIDGYRPRRSIVFASWGAGEFGSVGATEWLEGYLNILHLKAFSYINLDAAIQGAGSLRLSASPLMYSVIEKTLSKVQDPVNTDQLLYDRLGKESWKDKITPFSIEDSAFPFLAFSGIPSMSFSFYKDKPYAYLGTNEDNVDNFKQLENIDRMYQSATEFAAVMILHLTYDQILPLDITTYSDQFRRIAVDLNKNAKAVMGMNLSLKWINSARGDYYRAVSSLKKDIAYSDLENKEVLHALNDRVMQVEHNMLSPYVSPKDTPFRHILYGTGNHTVAALMDHLDVLKNNKSLFMVDLFKNQLALLTWTLQGVANALAGEIWDIDNEF